MKRQARFMSSVGGLVHLAHAPPIMTIADSDEEWAGALDQALDEEADDVVHVPFTCWNDQCARLDANLYKPPVNGADICMTCFYELQLERFQPWIEMDSTDTIDMPPKKSMLVCQMVHPKNVRRRYGSGERSLNR